MVVQIIHEEYVNICNNSDVAVIFIHGIVGTPNHFNDFLSVVPEGISVYNMLLDGHGKGVKDFAKTSMKKWENQVASVVEKLSETHEKIFIVAHSLGSLLAIEQSIKNKRVCKLFLLAVPLYLSIKLQMPINSLKVYFDKINDDDYHALAAKKCFGIEKEKNPLSYISWIPRFIELFAKIHKTREIIKLINVECSVIQSKRDEMVSRHSKKYFDGNPYISVSELENSAHYYYDKEDFNYIISEFTKMFTD